MKKGNQFNDADNIKKPKQGKGKKIIIIVLAVFLVLITILGVTALRIRSQVKNKQQVPQEQVELQEPEQEEKVVEEVVELVDEEIEGVTEVYEEFVYDYDNKFIGLKFNYNTDMYIKENTDIVFNTLKSVSRSGENFRIDRDKLTDILTVLQLTTGNSDGLVITVSLIPFEIKGSETQIEEIETTQTITEITSDNLKNYDAKIKETLEQTGITTDIFEESYLREIDGLKAIISERRYSGSTETATGVVDVIQGLIPVGSNAVLVTAITDGSPIDIDKVELFNEIIDSMVLSLTPVVEKPSSVDEPVQEEVEEVEKVEEIEEVEEVDEILSENP